MWPTELEWKNSSKARQPPVWWTRAASQWGASPSFGWEAILERDEIQWGSWRSKFVRVRHFKEGGGWNESARVDLSQSNRPLALMVRWGSEEPMSKEQLVELLNRVEMLEPAGQGTGV